MLLSLLLASALSQSPGDALERGRALAEELRFAEAVEALEAARKEPLAKPERVEALQLLAKCLVAQGLRPRAEQIYTELLSVEPATRLPADTSPKLQEVFDAVKARVYPPGYFALEPLPGPSTSVRLRVIDPYVQLLQLELVTREGPDGEWHRRALRLVDGAASEALAPGAHGLDWYVEALTEESRLLASVGTAEQPRRVLADGPFQAPARRAATTQDRLGRAAGWLTGGLGVLAFGLAVAFGVHGAGLAAAAKDGSKPPGDWADTARAANLAAADFSTAGLVSLLAGLGLAGAAAIIFAW